MRVRILVLVILVACMALVYLKWGIDREPPLLRPQRVLVQPSKMARPVGILLDVESYPRTNGSTSAEPLSVWVAARVLGLRVRWSERVRGEFEGEFRLYPYRAGMEYRKDPFAGRTRATGTHDAYVALINGEADLIYECRQPSEDELALMKQAGVELDIRPIARDAFVFIRQVENPVTNLTMQQVRGIYTPDEDGTAAITNWNQVGGPDATINAYTRNRNSGSQETMRSLVLGGGDTHQGDGLMAKAMYGPYNKLHHDPSGISYTFYYYQHYMSPGEREQIGYIGYYGGDKDYQPPDRTFKGKAITTFAIDGVAPSRETIADSTYPLITEVYVVTRKDLDPTHPAAKLRDWLLTEEGQSVIGETGYVPITPLPKE